MALRERHRRARRSAVAEGAPGRRGLPPLRWTERSASAGKEPEQPGVGAWLPTGKSLQKTGGRGGDCVKKPGKKKKTKKKPERDERHLPSRSHAAAAAAPSPPPARR